MLKRRITAVLTLLISLFVLSGCVVVEDGTVGIGKSFGKIKEEQLSPTWYFNIPIAREVEVWNTKTQRRSMNLDIPSAEGLIVKLQSTVLFRPQEVVRLRKEVGPAFVQIVLDSTLIDTFREVIGKQKVEEIITNQESLTTAVKTSLKQSMESRGIIIEDLMITGLELPVKFKDAIERKLA